MEKLSAETSVKKEIPGTSGASYDSAVQIYALIYNSKDLSAVESFIRGLCLAKGVCGKTLQRNEYAWRCLTCGKDENAIICDECYQASYHVGHKTVRLRVNGGNCDCGDPDVWSTKGACPKHAGGFTDENQVSPTLFPESMRGRIVNAVDATISRLNYCCLQLEAAYSESAANPGDVQILSQQYRLEIVAIAEVLGHLSKDVSPIFLHMIASRLHGYSLEWVTKHACNVRKFDNEAEKSHFDEVCAKHLVDPRNCRVAGTSHPCTCTVLENFMKIFHILDTATMNTIITNFLQVLLANRRFKYYFALSFFANYEHMIPCCSRDGGLLETLAEQCLGYEDVTESVVQTPDYLRLIAEQLERIITKLPEYLKTKRDTISFELDTISFNISTLMTEKYLKSYYSFIQSFVKKLAAFQQYEIRSHKSKDFSRFRLISDLGSILEQTFLMLLSSVNLSDISLCKPLASTFKEAIMAKKPEVDADSGVYSVVLYRCLSLFLTNFLMKHYWRHPDPLKMKELIYDFFSFGSEAECQLFVEECLKWLFRYIGFLIEVHCGDWQDQDIVPQTKKALTQYEFSLVAILLTLTNIPNLLQWTFNTMHRDAEKAWGRIEAARGNKSPTAQFASPEESKRTTERLQQVTEHILYVICCLASNDTTYFEPIFLYKKMRESKRMAQEKPCVAMQDYLEYAISKHIVMAYVRKGDHTGVNSKDINERFPQPLRDLNKIEKCLEGISSPFMDKINRVVKFKMSDEALKVYDPFYYYLKTYAYEEQQHSMWIMKRLRDPQKYDHFFGELATGEQGLMRTGEPFIPVKLLLRQRLAQSDAVPILAELAESEDREFITPMMVRCSYKMLLACVQHRPNGLALQNAMIKNMDKFLFEEGMRDIIEKYKQAMNPPLSIIEEAKESESTPIMSRQVSKVDKTKSLEVQRTVVEEFKEKIAAFQSKNKTILGETHCAKMEQDSLVCAHCRDMLLVSKFGKEPYGRIVYIHKSRAYGYHLNQILARAKHRAWGKGCQLVSVPGVTHGLVLTSCGHYLHEKCWHRVLEKPPNNAVCKIDKEHHPNTFLCPLCKSCGNSLLTPQEIVLGGDSYGVQRIQEGLMNELIEARRSYVALEPKGNERFRLICEYITYQFHLVDLTDTSDYAIKSDCIHSLVHCLKTSLVPDLYNNMMVIKEDVENSLGFLFGDPHALFSADLLSIYTQLVVAAKIIESPGRFLPVTSEFLDKTHDLIRLAVIQILLGITCGNLKNDFSREALGLALQESSVASIIKNTKRVEKRLLPLLRKMLCVKLTVFPDPGCDVKTEITKIGWIGVPQGVDYYLKALKTNRSIIESLLEPAPESTKEVFLKLPTIAAPWMFACFKSLLQSIPKDGDILASERWPMLVLYKAGTKRFSLIDLPEDFDKLQSCYIGQPCAECKKTVRDNAVCLFCGTLLCVAKESAKVEGKGELSYHGSVCVAGCGMYLRLAQNKILIVDGAQACACPSPYVNKYGESVDISKSHEKEALSLEPGILEELKDFYLSHSIPQKTRSISLRSDSAFFSSKRTEVDDR